MAMTDAENSKYEARNPKQIQSPKRQIQNGESYWQTPRLLFWEFKFAVCFGFRASSFVFCPVIRLFVPVAL
jgi:hypothetical protein